MITKWFLYLQVYKMHKREDDMRARKLPAEIVQGDWEKGKKECR